MGFLQDIFTTQKKQQTGSTANSTTQGNDWSQLQPFFEDYLKQYSPDNIKSATVPINPYQTAAAQATQAIPGMTNPAMSTANTVASNGIDPATISKFMSPYTSSVVQPMMDVFHQQQLMGLNDLRGNQASQGALGNNTGSEAAYLAALQPQQEAQLAQLYNTGFSQALGAAGTSTQAQLTAANTGANIAGVNTAADTALANQGQTQWNDAFQNAQVPFALYQSGAQGVSPFTQAAGTTTNSSATGYTNTQDIPSEGGAAAGVIGTGLKLGAAAGLRFGGPSRAAGGAAPMPEFKSGEDFASKVMKAHEIVHHIRTKNTEASKQAMMPHRDMGGDVGLGSWMPTVTQGDGGGSGFDLSAAGDAFNGLSKATMWGPDSQAGQPKPQQAAAADPAPSNGNQPSMLQRIINMTRPAAATGGPQDGLQVPADVGDPYAGVEGMPDSPSGPSSMEAMWEHMPLYRSAPDAVNWATTMPGPHFDPGPRQGVPGSPMGPRDPNTPTPQPAMAPMMDVADRTHGDAYPMNPERKLGMDTPNPAAEFAAPEQVPAGERAPTSSGDGWWSGFKSMLPSADKLDRVGNILTSVGREGDPFKDVASNALKQRTIDIAAGHLGLEAAKNPAEIGALEAQSAPSQIAMKQAELANQQALQRQMLEYYMQLRKQAAASHSGGAGNRMSVWNVTGAQ